MSSKKLFRPWDEKCNPSKQCTSIGERLSQNINTSSLNPINFIKSLLISTSTSTSPPTHSTAISSSSSSSPLSSLSSSSLFQSSASSSGYPLMPNFSPSPFLWSNGVNMQRHFTNSNLLMHSSLSTSSPTRLHSSSGLLSSPLFCSAVMCSTNDSNNNKVKSSQLKSEHNEFTNATVNSNGNSIKKQRPKKFRCNYCQIAFSNNGQLKGHIRTHTGNAPLRHHFCQQTEMRW